MNSARRAVWVAAAGLVATTPACGSDDEGHAQGEVVGLVDAAAWSLDEDIANDPIPGHRPPLVDCNPNGVLFEDGLLELDTRFCNYFIVSQPSGARVRAGERLTLDWSHTDLDAAAPAEAHFALALDGELQWETIVQVPKDASAYRPSWVVTRDYPAGSRVTLHLHNHGFNNYKVLNLNCSAP
jgi:hypothetical protein